MCYISSDYPFSNIIIFYSISNGSGLRDTPMKANSFLSPCFYLGGGQGGCTALMMASLDRGNLKMVEMLLEKGAMVDMLNEVHVMKSCSMPGYSVAIR